MKMKLFGVSESDDAVEEVLGHHHHHSSSSSVFSQFESCRDDTQLHVVQQEQYGQLKVFQQAEATKFLQENCNGSTPTSPCHHHDAMYECLDSTFISAAEEEEDGLQNHAQKSLTFVYRMYHVLEEEALVNGVVFLFPSFGQDISTFNAIASRLVSCRFHVVLLKLNYHDLNVSLFDIDSSATETAALSYHIWRFVLHIVDKMHMKKRKKRIFIGGSGLGASLALQTYMKHVNRRNDRVITGLILLNPWLQFKHVTAQNIDSTLTSSLFNSIPIINGRFNEYSSLQFAIKVADHYYSNYVRDKLSVQIVHTILQLLNHLTDCCTIYNVPVFIGQAKNDTVMKFERVKSLFTSNQSTIKQLKLYGESKHELLWDASVLEVIEDVTSWLLDAVEEVENSEGNLSDMETE